MKNIRKSKSIMETNDNMTPQNGEFDFAAVPKRYTLCYHEGCPLHDRCMRFLAATHAPASLEVRRCVLPTAEKDGHCRWLDPIETVTMAEGFTGLYDKVLKGDYTPLRKQLTAYLHGPKQYYQYMRGERPLSPAQQQGIRRIVSSYGYDWDVPFERYIQAYRFGKPPVVEE
jgi:hypothetical protein